MMARINEADVQAIMSVKSSITDLSPFIAAASSLVTEKCVGVGYDDDRLALIETWLAAHFVAIRDPRLSSQSVGGAGGSYQGQTTMMLSATTYGQQAMLLDTAGALSVLNENTTRGRSPVVGITWLGTERESSSE
jgi:hypothetical protein